MTAEHLTDVASIAKARLANGLHVADYDVGLLVAEIARLREANQDLVRAAKSLLGRYNYHTMAEDDSVCWRQLSDACLRSGQSLEGKS